MKKFLITALSLFMLASCSNDKTHVINNNERVSLLEARVALNEANDGMLEARVSSLEIRMNDAESRLDGLDTSLQSFMDQTNSDIADLRQTDSDLADRLDNQAQAIAFAFGQIALLHAKDAILSSKIDSLKSRVLALENEVQNARQGYPSLDARLDSMQSNISLLNTKVSSLQSNVAALNMAAALQMVVDAHLQYQINALNARVDQNSSNISSLISQMNSVTNTINSFSSIYLTQADAQAYVTQLQNQIAATNVIATSAVTQAQLQAAIAAIQLLPGPQGAQGPAGINGTNGTNGTNGLNGTNGVNGSTAGMSAVKLCAADNATHPEYGFVVGDSIYAVYYGVVGGTLSAFLAKLNAGSYVTTNDNTPCGFTVSYSNGNSYIDGVQVNPVVTPVVVASQLTYVSQQSRQNGGNNNASINVTFKNNGSTTLTKFKVTVAGLGSSAIRAGSSLTGPYGNVESYTASTITYLITSSGGLAPNANVSFTILIDSLTGSQNLSFTAEAL